jgi:hypothetical protein
MTEVPNLDLAPDPTSSPTPSTEFSVCQSLTCGEVFAGLATACPKCGYPALGQARVRTLGWVLMVCGAVVFGIIAFASWFMIPLIVAGGETVDGSRFSGSADNAFFIVGVFVLVAAIGAAIVLSGLIQVRRGRPDRRLVKGMLVLVAVFYVIAWLARRGFSG